MDIAFTPSPDVAVILNTLLDKLEQRAQRNTPHASLSTQPAPRNPQPATRSIKLLLTDLPLPAYFSQTDPEPRLIANQQLQELAKLGLLTVTWLPGETSHLLAAVTLQTQHATRNPPDATRNTEHATPTTPDATPLYSLLQRTPLAASRTRLESLLLADQFRFPAEDWRARGVRHVLSQLRAGKSPTPFSLTNAEWNLDLLTVLAALPSLEAETPSRVFSVHIFNDSKRFDELKPALVRLARRANPEWKSLPADEILRELNLVANPTHIHLAGNWQITTTNGEVLSLGGFTPSIGFPAAQTIAIQSVTIHADAVLCIENLTTFHEFIRAQEITQRNTHHGPNISCSVYALICIHGNPSPSIRHILRLIPVETPIYLWADLDYGGFNILGQLRGQISPRIQPCWMGIPTFDAHAQLSRPLTQNDQRNLKHLASHPGLQDVRPVIAHLLKRGLKMEQEALDLRFVLSCPPFIPPFSPLRPLKNQAPLGKDGGTEGGGE